MEGALPSDARAGFPRGFDRLLGAAIYVAEPNFRILAILADYRRRDPSRGAPSSFALRAMRSTR